MAWKKQKEAVGMLKYLRPIRKEFGIGQYHVTERVAQMPSIMEKAARSSSLEGIFCLRIDADEYSKEAFSLYYDLFKEHNDKVTIFFNVNSFKDSCEEILQYKDLGVDVQSHGFYHYTYNDYNSNKYNIKKAKDFFKQLGIDTCGFAAPMGKWNFSLIRALEDEGYIYSSDFSYDYLGLPSYPKYGMYTSSVLEIPIFPVCPELFYENRICQTDYIVSYYKKAIDEITACGLPVIIYAHTSTQYKKVPYILQTIIDYAISKRKLSPKNMTEIANIWKSKVGEPKEDMAGKVPASEYLGVEKKDTFYDIIKNRIKEYMDFEQITPAEELKSGKLKRFLKLCARGVFKGNS
jgi:hypothetical protein